MKDSHGLERIVVVGSTGSGKTTLARRLSDRLGIAHVELDALNWGPNWTQRPPDEFRLLVTEALAPDAWVTDGNYSRARDITWGRAQTIVWLNYPLWVNLWRLFTRTIRRTVSRQELWSGNRESIRSQFASRDSLFLWLFQTYRRRRREYPDLFGRPEHAHLQVIVLTSPRATRRWLASIDLTP